MCMSYMCGEYMFICAYISYMCMVYVCVWYVGIYVNNIVVFQKLMPLIFNIFLLVFIYSWTLNIMVAQYKLTNWMVGMGGWAVCW